MTIFRDLSSIYTSLFSLILMIVLFESRCSKKRMMHLTLCSMIPLMAINIILLFILGPQKMSTLLLLTCTLPSLLFFGSIAKYRDGRFFFTFFFVDTLILEILYITSILDFFIGNTYLFMMVSRLILCPLLTFAIYRWFRPIYLDLQNKISGGWYVFTIISLIFYVLLSLSISVPTIITERLEQLPAFILLLILMPAIYVHIFSTLRHQQQLFQIKEQEDILSIQVTSLSSRIKEFTAINDHLRKERHDFHHKLNTLAALAAKKQYTELQDTIKEYADSPGESLPESYCSYPILDAVLVSYLQMARQHHIRVSADITFPDSLSVNQSELATVFANAIENAINACEEIEEEQRYIEIRSIIKPAFMFRIQNSFNGCIAFDDAGIPISQRKGHGFGTRSIAAFCEKNDGFCEFKAEENTFMVNIVFSSDI